MLSLQAAVSVSLQTEQRLPHGHLHFHVGATSLSFITPSLFFSFDHTLSHCLAFSCPEWFPWRQLWSAEMAQSSVHTRAALLAHMHAETLGQSYARESSKNNITSNIFVCSFIKYANNT